MSNDERVTIPLEDVKTEWSIVTLCMICGKEIPLTNACGGSIYSAPMVCQECKDAIEWAKKRMKCNE